MKTYKKIIAGLTLALAAAALAGCSSDSEVVSRNLSTDADNFKIERRIVFYNGITDKYMLTIEGKCSQTNEGKQLVVTCKVGKDAYKKHFLGLSDNVTYFSEQLDAADVSEYHYKVVFKPEEVLPDLDLNTSAGDK